MILATIGYFGYRQIVTPPIKTFHQLYTQRKVLRPKSILNSPPPKKHLASVNIIMDGWSHKIAQVNPLEYSFTNSAATNPTPYSPVVWQPMSVNDLAYLMHYAPQKVATLYQRMVTSDTSVACSSQTCTASSTTLTPSMLLHISAIPHYAKEYQAYGINHPVYIARIKIPAGSSEIFLKPASYKHARMIFGTNRLNISPSAGNAYNGYGINTFFVGDAFGHLFHLRTPASGRFNYNVTNTPSVSSNAISTALSQTTMFAHGLTAKLPSDVQLSNTQLAALSSPVTGCLPGVLCVPTPASPSVTTLNTHSVPVCTTSTGKTTTTALFYDTKWGYNFTSPTAEFGINNGAKQSNLTVLPGTHITSTWNGFPPLVTGQQSMRQSWTMLFSNSSITYLGGHSAQYGVDSSSALNTPYNSALLPQINSAWKKC